MSSPRAARPNASQKAIVQRRYRRQDEACEQAIKLLLAKAEGRLQSPDGRDDEKETKRLRQ